MRRRGTRHGHERPHDAALTVSPRDSSSSRKPPVIAASTTSLTVPPSAARICLMSRQRRAGPVPAAVRADRAVERRLGGGRGASPRTSARPLASSRAAGRCPRTRARPQRRPQLLVAGCARCCASASSTSSARARLGRRLPDVGDGGDGLGRRVEHDGQQVGARDAVDHAVVRLRDQRPAAVLEALDDPHLPERLCGRAAATSPARPGCGARRRRPGAAAPCAARGTRG